jgi:hypothetical protein
MGRRAAPSARLLVAATARRLELDDGHPLVELATGLQALEHCSEIKPGRLDCEQTVLPAARIGGRRRFPRPSSSGSAATARATRCSSSRPSGSRYLWRRPWSKLNSLVNIR